MVVDLGVGIEGTVEDELPEALLCQTRYDKVDLDGGARLVVGAHQSSSSASTSTGATTGALPGTSTTDKSPVRATAASAELNSSPTVTTQSSSSKHRNQQKS